MNTEPHVQMEDPNGELSLLYQALYEETLLGNYELWQDQTSWYAHSGQHDAMELAYLALGVAGEAGETADQVKKMLREHGEQAMEMSSGADILKLVKELGDVQWYVTRFCRMLGITVHELVLINMVKLHQRMHDKWKAHKGDYQWPLNGLSYEDALRLTQHIEARITKSAVHT